VEKIYREVLTERYQDFAFGETKVATEGKKHRIRELKMYFSVFQCLCGKEILRRRIHSILFV